jgi:hypothetical protein
MCTGSEPFGYCWTCDSRITGFRQRIPFFLAHSDEKSACLKEAVFVGQRINRGNMDTCALERSSPSTGSTNLPLTQLRS